MSLRQELGIICRALILLVGAVLPVVFSLLSNLLFVPFQNWQGFVIVTAFALEALIFGWWSYGRLTRPWLAGLASGALGLEVGFVAVTLTINLPVSSDGFVEWLTGSLVAIALCHGFASWKLFATARKSGWRNALGTFFAGAIALATALYTLFALLPAMPND